MALIGNLLPGIQIVLCVLLVGAILLQQRGAGLGGAFGDQGQETFYKRRGAEQFLFRISIVLAVLLVASALAALAI